jgi:DNA-binding CsgD family transcriptional regulator
LRVPDGIRAAAKQDDKRLQELIIGARRTSTRMTMSYVPGGHVAVSRPSGRQAYAIMVAPVGPDLAGTGKSVAAVLLFVSDPGQELLSDLAILKELFDFPPSEAKLVLALLNGIGPPDFARQAGVSYNTVRTLLVRAMDRTNTRSQLQLVLLVARSLGGLAAKSPSLSAT